MRGTYYCFVVLFSVGVGVSCLQHKHEPICVHLAQILRASTKNSLLEIQAVCYYFKYAGPRVLHHVQYAGTKTCSDAAGYMFATSLTNSRGKSRINHDESLLLTASSKPSQECH